VEALILWCREGPPDAEVKGVEVHWETPDPDPSREESPIPAFRIL
jgi:hypothetical protein